MTHPSRAAAGLAWALILIMPAIVRADDDDTRDYRSQIMHTMGEQAGALGQILQQKVQVPPENFAVHVKVIAITAATAKKAFEPNVPGGQAKPEVWSDWADFSKKMEEFAKATDTMLKLAKTKGKQAALANVLDALPCKGCHDKYRDESKKDEKK
jgi:cytochrome c556